MRNTLVAIVIGLGCLVAAVLLGRSDGPETARPSSEPPAEATAAPLPPAADVPEATAARLPPAADVPEATAAPPAPDAPEAAPAPAGDPADEATRPR